MLSFPGGDDVSSEYYGSGGDKQRQTEQNKKHKKVVIYLGFQDQYVLYVKAKSLEKIYLGICKEFSLVKGMEVVNNVESTRLVLCH